MARKDGLKRERRERAKRVDRQKKAANIRAKYGPSRKPAPVIVKSLETGEVVAVEDQSKFAKKVYAESLEQKARDAGFASYTAYLRSSHWRGLRDRVLRRDGHRCRRCRGRAGLSVHHRYYAVLGSESLDSLETLCGRCHRRVHE